jgi:glycolate oxidase FAD binding subunit
MKVEAMQPATEVELAEYVRAATGPLAIVGGGTRAIGAVVGQPLHTAGLSGIELYEPGALTLVAKAGTPVAEITARLASERQRLGFEVPDLRAVLGRSGTSTIGGVVASNASGPRRVQVGGCRDALLGVRFVDGRGEVVKNGGRVMKNVTGYDLVKLMAGARGSLGVLTEVSFKVQAMPEAEATLACDCDAAAGLADLRKALGSPFDVSGAAWINGRALLRIEGMAGSVAYRAERLRALLPGWQQATAEWRDVRDVLPFAGRAGSLWRLVVTPTAAAEIVTRLGGEAIYDWGGGLVWLLLPTGCDVRAVVGPRGHATLMRGEDTVAALPPELPAVAALTAGLRAKFDPRGIFNVEGAR